MKDDNNLTGPIPTEIGYLTSLTELYICKCDLKYTFEVQSFSTLSSDITLSRIHHKCSNISAFVPVRIMHR